MPNSDQISAKKPSRWLTHGNGCRRPKPVHFNTSPVGRRAQLGELRQEMVGCWPAHWRAGRSPGPCEGSRDRYTFQVSPCHTPAGSQKIPTEPTAHPRLLMLLGPPQHTPPVPAPSHLPRACHGGWEGSQMSGAGIQGRVWPQPAGTRRKKTIEALGSFQNVFILLCFIDT